MELIDVDLLITKQSDNVSHSACYVFSLPSHSNTLSTCPQSTPCCSPPTFSLPHSSTILNTEHLPRLLFLSLAHFLVLSCLHFTSFDFNSLPTVISVPILLLIFALLPLSLLHTSPLYSFHIPTVVTIAFLSHTLGLCTIALGI